LCPLDVFQEGSDLRRGSLLRFSTYANTSTIYEAMDLNVKFSKETKVRCNEPTVWKVDNYDESRGQWFITTGGVEGNPGPQTLQNWFKFEKIGDFSGMYKIVHCPSVCESCVHLCSNVGVSHDNNRRLALSDFQFLVVIFPYEETSSAYIRMV
ncbi:Kunitz family serine protease inhibitor, partial [Staphylococcus aureus]